MPHNIKESIQEAIDLITSLQGAISRDMKPYVSEHTDVKEADLAQTHAFLEGKKKELRDKIKEEIKPEVVAAALGNVENILTILGALNQVLTQKSAAVRQEIEEYLVEKRELEVIKELLHKVKADKKFSETVNKLGRNRDNLSHYIFELEKIARLITKLEGDVISETLQEGEDIKKIGHEVDVLIKIKDHDLAEINNALSNSNSSDSDIHRKIVETITSIDRLHQGIDLEKVTQRRETRRENWTILKNYNHINKENKQLEKNLKAIETICAKGIRGEVTTGLNLNIKGALEEIDKEIIFQERIIQALENILDSVSPAIVQETQQIALAAQELKTHLTDLQGLLPQPN